MDKTRGVKRRSRGRGLAVLLLALCMIICMMPIAVFADPAPEDASGSGMEAAGETEKAGIAEEPDAFLFSKRDGGAAENTEGAALKAGWTDSIYVLGIQVSSSNCNDVLGDGGSVKYDRDTRTITLNNAKLDLAKYDSSAFTETNKVCGLSTWQDTNIVLMGSSRIISSGSSFEEGMEYVYGIEAISGLCISGSGSLSIEIDTADASASGINKYYGIDSTRHLSIKNSKLTISMNGKGESYGIYTGSRGFDLSENAEVRVVSAGGNNRAVYDNSYNKSSIEFGSKFEMLSDYAAFQFSKLPDSITEGSILVNTRATPQGAVEWDKETRLTSFKYIRLLGKEGGEERASSTVYILGRKISDGEVPATVPHKGKIEYDSDAARLTLTDATIDLDDFAAMSPSGNLAVGIYATSAVNIVLNGTNTIYSSLNEYPSGTEYVSGIEGWDTIALSGDRDSSLSVSLAGNNSGNRNIQFCGISSDDSITVGKVSLSVNMGSYGKCTGIYAWKPIYANNGARVKVNADGSESRGVSGVNSIGNSEVNDDSVLEMSSEGSAFYCWTPGPSLKETDALVGNKKDGTGAYAWDGKSALYEYKYVKFIGPDGEEGGGERFGDDVRVLGRKIDTDNCSDVLNDGGSVRFDFDSNTLTLTNAQLDLKYFHHEYDDDPNPDSGTNMVIGIDADRDITIVLLGANRIFSTAQSYDQKKQYVKGIDSGSRNIITVTGEGSLAIDLDKSNDALNYEGIVVGGGFIVDGVPVTVNMGGVLKGTGIDCMMSDLTLKNGAMLRVSAAGEGSTAVDYVMASGLSIDDSSMLEMISDGTAFDCWILSAEVKDLGALVNDQPVAEGAYAWDKSAMFDSFKYVRFPEVYTHTHSISHVPKKNATCEEPGNDEYWVCSSCGRYFTGEDGETETDPPAIYPATGHKWGDWKSTSEAQHQRICKNDNSHKEISDHTWDKGRITRIATLLRKGEKTYTCTVCGGTKKEKFSLRDAVEETAEKVTKKIAEWIKKIFGGDDPDAITAKLSVSISEESFKYNGKVQKPAVVSVMAGDIRLDADDYSVKYSDPESKDAGSYSIKVFVNSEDYSVSGEAVYTIAPAEITCVNIDKTSFTYSGKVQKPAVDSVKAGNLDLTSSDRSVSYSKGKSADAGKYTLTVKGKGNFCGSKTVQYSIDKAENTLSARGRAVTVKYKKLKKKAQTVMAIDVKHPQGKVSYQLTGVRKAKYKKYFKVNPSTGKITIRKKLKKGSYAIRVQVSAEGNSNYAAGTEEVTVNIKVK